MIFNGSYLYKRCRARLEFSLIGDKFPTIANLTKNMLSRSEEARGTVESMISPAASKSTKEPFGSAVEELTAMVAELEIAKNVEEKDSKFSKMLWITDPSWRRSSDCARKSQTLPRPIATCAARTD